MGNVPVTAIVYKTVVYYDATSLDAALGCLLLKQFPSWDKADYRPFEVSSKPLYDNNDNKTEITGHLSTEQLLQTYPKLTANADVVFMGVIPSLKTLDYITNVAKAHAVTVIVHYGDNGGGSDPPETCPKVNYFCSAEHSISTIIWNQFVVPFSEQEIKKKKEVEEVYKTKITLLPPPLPPLPPPAIVLPIIAEELPIKILLNEEPVFKTTSMVRPAIKLQMMKPSYAEIIQKNCIKKGTCVTVNQVHFGDKKDQQVKDQQDKDKDKKDQQVKEQQAKDQQLKEMKEKEKDSIVTIKLDKEKGDNTPPLMKLQVQQVEEKEGKSLHNNWSLLGVVQGNPLEEWVAPWWLSALNYWVKRQVEKLSNKQVQALDFLKHLVPNWTHLIDHLRFSVDELCEKQNKNKKEHSSQIAAVIEQCEIKTWVLPETIQKFVDGDSVPVIYATVEHGFDIEPVSQRLLSVIPSHGNYGPKFAVIRMKLTDGSVQFNLRRSPLSRVNIHQIAAIFGSTNGFHNAAQFTRVPESNKEMSMYL